MQLKTGLLLLCAAVALSACKDRGVPGEQRDPEFAAKNLLSAEPTPKNVVNADLGGKVVYLGNDVDKSTLKPGDKFTVVHYFKVVQPPGPDYKLFTHVKGAGKDWMNVDATKMRSSYPVADWKAGDIIRDEQTITLKGDWTSPTATINVGIYKRGDSSEKARLPIVTGPNDGHGAVIAAHLTISGKSATPPAPTPDASAKASGGYVIKRAAGPLVIDGKADEASWASAASTGAFQAAEGMAAPLPTSARLLYDDKFLYAFIDVTDADVYSEFKKPDDPLWKADVVELFIDADKNGKGYVELQVNPNNAQFDSWFVATRTTGKADESWTSGIVSAVVVDGTADKRDDKDSGWHAEIAIPWEAVKGKDVAMAVKLPPNVGDSFKLNFVRVDGGKQKSDYTASSWAPITRADFHAIDKLYVVTFGTEKGDVPQAAGPAVPTPAPAAPVPATPEPVVAPGAAVPTPMPMRKGDPTRMKTAPGVIPAPAPQK